MKLLVFAHRGEAQAFLRKLDLKSFEQDFLYGNQDTLVLISGEGIQNTTETLAFTLAKYPVKEIVNLGIAGALRGQEKNSIHSIRTVYHHHEEPSFQSFTSSDVSASTDCLSYYKRVTQSLDKKQLSQFAGLVDRELWAIASVSKRFKVPWRSYKIVSDITEEQTDCQDIFEKAYEFSLKLFHHTHPQPQNLIEDLESQGFWITFSEAKKIEKLFKLTQPDYSSIANSEMTGKQKTQKLIQLLEESVDPITFKVRKKIKKELKANNSSKTHYSVDNQLEETRVQVKSLLEDDRDVQDLIESLQKFPLKEIQSLMDGDLR